MNLMNAMQGQEYLVRTIATDDDDLNSFLFSLGCYTAEPLTVISRRTGRCTNAN